MPSTENDSRLFIKSYFAASVVDAMERARVELGPDALLMNTREAPPEARHLGECEVVFGIRPPAPPAAGASPAAVDPVADLRQRMEELREMVGRLAPGADHQPECPTVIGEELLKAGVTRALAAEIEAAVQQRLRGRGVVMIAVRIHARLEHRGPDPGKPPRSWKTAWKWLPKSAGSPPWWVLRARGRPAPW